MGMDAQRRNWFLLAVRWTTMLPSKSTKSTTALMLALFAIASTANAAVESVPPVNTDWYITGAGASCPSSYPYSAFSIVSQAAFSCVCKDTQIRNPVIGYN